MNARARRDLYWAIAARLPWRYWPRPGRCFRCGRLAWLTNETPTYSAFNGSFICEPCAIDNDADTNAAWAEYYGGRL